MALKKGTLCEKVTIPLTRDAEGVANKAKPRSLNPSLCRFLELEPASRGVHTYVNKRCFVFCSSPTACSLFADTDHLNQHRKQGTSSNADNMTSFTAS